MCRRLDWKRESGHGLQGLPLLFIELQVILVEVRCTLLMYFEMRPSTLPLGAVGSECWGPNRVVLELNN